jgi:hypothetical protein
MSKTGNICDIELAFDYKEHLLPNLLFQIDSLP